MRARMPGAFPENAQQNSFSITPGTSELLNQQQLDRFQQNHQINQKTKHQHNIITQLETLVYILAGYQFIKYCHSACLVPIFFHMVLQKMISFDFSNSTHYGTSMVANLISLQLMGQNQEGEQRPPQDELVARTYGTIRNRTCLAIYWKTIFTMFYHTLFISNWVVGLANAGKLQKLESGTWWFISFIGEQTPRDVGPETGFWTKLLKLGLPELLLTDFLILFIQLVLFQCVFNQFSSTLVRRPVSEDEVYVIRASNDTSRSTGNRIRELDQDIPCVLKVKLYETFSRDAFEITD